jgi:hypothetical protein
MMELPRRILDGGAGEWERVVVSSAALDAPSAESRQHLLRTLGVALGAAGIATTATSAVSAAKAAGGALWLKWAALGFAIGLAGVSAASLVTKGATPTPAENPVPTVVAVAAPSTRVASPVGVAPSEAVVDEARATPLPAASAERASARADRAAMAAAPLSSADATGSEAPAGPLGTARFEAPGESELAAQMAAIHGVRAALAGNEPALALRQIDQYERTYPAGLLLPEAEVLRIDSYSALGDFDSVKRLARSFLTQHPGSPYARHVQALIDRGTNR